MNFFIYNLRLHFFLNNHKLYNKWSIRRTGDHRETNDIHCLVFKVIYNNRKRKIHTVSTIYCCSVAIGYFSVYIRTLMVHNTIQCYNGIMLLQLMKLILQHFEIYIQ